MFSTDKLPNAPGIDGEQLTTPSGTETSRLSNEVLRSQNGDAAAQAWGEHDVGEGTGIGNAARGKPQKSPGSRPPKASAASKSPVVTALACSTKPYRARPAAQMALSWGQTEPL